MKNKSIHVPNVASKPDQSFDSIAQKFQQSIYGTTKGRLRHEILLNNLTDAVLSHQTKPLSIIDVGGGTGQMTASMAALGHHVVLNDVSADTLAVAKPQLTSLKNVEFQQGKLQTLSFDNPFDLVMCHAVLEWLESPFDAIEHLLGLVAKNGYLSLSFFNKDAQRFGNILYGNFDYVQANLQVKKKVKLNPNQPLYPKDVIDFLSSKHVNVLLKSGVRCFHDYLQDRQQQTTHYEQLISLEKEYCRQEPYLWLGKYFHIIVQKL